MSEEGTTEEPAVSDAPSPAKETESVSLMMGLGALLTVGLTLMVWCAATFGLWEPWETGWAELAQNMRTEGRWFAPALGKAGALSAPRPPLPIWMIAMGQSLFGDSEWGMRLPMTLAVMGGLSVTFVWLREVFGGWRALLASAITLTCPLIFLSGVSLAGNGVFVGALMATVALFGLALARRDEQGVVPMPLAAALGVMLAVDALSWGLWGLWLPLSIAITLGLIENAAREDTGWQRHDLAGLAVLGAVALVGGVASQSWGPKTVQWVTLLAPPLVLVAAALSAWKSAIFRAMSQWRWAAALAPPTLALLVAAWRFSVEAPPDPLSVQHPTLTFLLENHLIDLKALPEHVSFDFWVRQIGFAAYPWTALLPFGLAYLLKREELHHEASYDAETQTSTAPQTDERSETSTSDQTEQAEHTEQAPGVHVPALTEAQVLGLRLLSAWFFLALLASFLLGTVHEQYLFVGVAPMGLAAGLALTDEDFWAWLQQRPLLLRALGFTAMAVVLFLSKDLERYPKELLGPLLTDGEVNLPEGFSYGTSLKLIRYTLLGLLGLWFFGVLTWGRRLWDFRKKVANVPAPAELRFLEKTSRRPTILATLLVITALVLTGFIGARWVPALSQHLSSKGLLAAYERLATQDEPLLVYEVGAARSGSYYFSDNERVLGLANLKKRFLEDKERFFMILPESRLANLNYEVRKATKAPRRGIHVLDSRSGRFVLASNTLLEGESEQSKVTRAISSERLRPVFQITPTNEKNARVYAQFDNKLQFVGYEIYSEDQVDEWGEPLKEAQAELRALKKANKPPTFKTGTRFVIRYFFKVLKRVSTSQKIFLHVDYPGTRINGDHVPVDGALPTNQWLPGDYIVDTQWLDIEPGSPSGEYKMYMGFFLGSRRMKVTPASAHDGDNRIELGTIKVETF